MPYLVMVEEAGSSAPKCAQEKNSLEEANESAQCIRKVSSSLTRVWVQRTDAPKKKEQSCSTQTRR